MKAWSVLVMSSIPVDWYVCGGTEADKKKKNHFKGAHCNNMHQIFSYGPAWEEEIMENMNDWTSFF